MKLMIMNIKTNYSTLTQLPQGENPDEWIAYNIHQIYLQAQLFTEILKHHCFCKSMSVGDKTEYCWNEASGGAQIRITAMQYTQNVLDYTQKLLQNTFPQGPSDVFPQKFNKLAGEVVRRLLRIFIHAWTQHQDLLEEQNIQQEAGTCMRYILTFGTRFELISYKDLMPIKDIAIEWNIIQ